MITWNYLTPDPVFMDVETQSTADIRKVGGKAYIRDSSTRLLSAVFRRNGFNVVWVPHGRAPHDFDLVSIPNAQEVWCGDEVPFVVQGWIMDGCTFVAHNAEGFDAEFWDRHVKHPVPWFDTMHLCRLAGLPAGLDAASKAVGGNGKSDSDAMLLLSKAKAVGTAVRYPVGTAALWKTLIEYNIDDVLQLEHLYRYLSRITITPFEREVLQLNARINARGVCIDLPFARKLRDAWATAKNESTDRVAAMTGGELDDTNIASAPQVKKYLKTLGIVLESLDKRTVDQLLERPEKFMDADSTPAQLALALLAERQQAVRSTVGKLDRLFRVVDEDGAVRSCIVYHGAHTGRFSGRDLQPHNFPRGTSFEQSRLIPDVSLDAAKLVSSELQAKAKTPKHAREGSIANVLATLTRSVIRARPGCKLVVADFAAVEARGIAWVARCNAMLELFADAKSDVYCDMASKLFGRHITPKDKDERFIGKQIVLGCGYSMAAEKFDAGCKVYLVDLAASGTTAVECVDAYRKGYPEIPAVWRAYNKAARLAVEHNKASVAGRCLFEMQGSWLCIALPSGRVLRYRNARIVVKPPKYDLTGPPRPGVVYDTPHGYPKDLYGGILAENIVQAVCRDALCHCLVQLDTRHDCVLHVHDEGVFEVDERNAETALHDVARVMSTAPEWARGFPLAVEGFTCTHYTKYPAASEYHAKYINGAQV